VIGLVLTAAVLGIFAVLAVAVLLVAAGLSLLSWARTRSAAAPAPLRAT
jgi:hypothetical protein